MRSPLCRIQLTHSPYINAQCRNYEKNPGVNRLFQANEVFRPNTENQGIVEEWKRSRWWWRLWLKLSKIYKVYSEMVLKVMAVVAMIVVVRFRYSYL